MRTLSARRRTFTDKSNLKPSQYVVVSFHHSRTGIGNGVSSLALNSPPSAKSGLTIAKLESNCQHVFSIAPIA
jgi:hypothetical protein